MLKFDKIEPTPPPPPEYVLSGLTKRQAQILKLALYNLREHANQKAQPEIAQEAYAMAYAVETQDIFTSDVNDLYNLRT